MKYIAVIAALFALSAIADEIDDLCRERWGADYVMRENCVKEQRAARERLLTAAESVETIAPAVTAGPIRTDPTENVTVFTDEGGAHIVTLVRETLRENIDLVIKGKELGGVRERTLSPRPGLVAAFGLSGVAMAPTYWIRTRVVDGQEICEKFAVRSNRVAKDPARAAELAATLFSESCVTNTETDGRLMEIVRPPPKPVPR